MYNFNPILNAHLNELVTSDVYVAEKPDYLVVSDGEILINEKKVGNKADVKIGDEVRIVVLSSHEHSTAVHAVLTSSYGKYVFTVVTISSVQIKDIDGNFLNNYTGKEDRLVCYGFDKRFLKAINLSSPIDETEQENTILIPYYHGNHVLKLDTEHKKIVKRILVGRKPHSIVTIGDTSYITLSAENKVAILTNNKVTGSIRTGSRPVGIACSNDKKILYVANYLSGTVSCITIEDGKREDIKVSPGPYCVLVDNSDCVWVSSCLGANLTRIRNKKADYVHIGENSLGLLLSKDSTLWVMLPDSNSVGKISVEVEQPFMVRLHLPGRPSLIVPGSNSDANYVLCTGDHTLKEIDYVGDIVSTIQLDPYPKNVYRFVDSICVYNSEENDSSFLYLPAPFSSGIQEKAQELPRNTYVTTNELVVDNPKRLPVSVTGTFSAEIVKNGRNVGQASTTIEGDKLALRFKTPIGEDSIELRLFIGNFFINFNYVFGMENVLPEKFTIAPVVVQNPGEIVYASVRISLCEGKSIPFIVSSGKLTVNCMRTDANIAYVKNNDLVVIETESLPYYNRTLYVEISAGIYYTLWQITTGRDMFIEYIKPEHSHKRIYDLPFLPEPSNVVSKVLPSSNYRIVERPLEKEEGDFNESVYALSPLEDKIYELSVGSSATQEFIFPDKSRPIDYAKDTETSKLYVALQGTRKIVVLKGSLKLNYSTYDAIIELEKIPIALAVFKSDLYVLTDDGYLLIYKQNTGVYETIQVCSKPGAMAVDEFGHVWVYDLATESIREVSLSSTLKSVSAIPGKMGDVWALKCYKGVLWAVSAYDNALYKISIRKRRIEQQISLYATPSCIAINPRNGQVWVGHYGSNLVVKINPNMGEIENRILVDNPILGVQVDSNDNLWIIQPYKNIKKDQNRTSNLTQINPIKLFTFDKVTTDTLLLSNEVEIQGIIRPTMATVTPYMSTQIIVNNVRKGNATEVRSGDMLMIETKSPKEPDTEVVIYLTIGDVVVPFKFSTLDNEK